MMMFGRWRFSSVASLGAIAAVFIIGTAYLAFGVAKASWTTNYTNATMVLQNSGGLLPRSSVLLSGIKVGQVTSVTDDGRRVEVSFRIDNTYRVPASSTARIESLSALGEPYIEFTPTAAGGPYLHDGQTVDTRNVAAPVSIPDVSRIVTSLLNQLDPNAIKQIVDTFSQGLSGTETVIPQLSRSTSLLAATLLSRTETINHLLVQLQARGDNMAWAGPALDRAAGPWRDFGPKVSEVAEAIARVIRVGNFPSDYTTGTGLLPFVQQLTVWLNRVGPDLEKLVPVVQPVAVRATGVLHQIDLSSLISQALNATSADGTLHVELHVK